LIGQILALAAFGRHPARFIGRSTPEAQSTRVFADLSATWEREVRRGAPIVRSGVRSIDQTQGGKVLARGLADQSASIGAWKKTHR
jgi:hypothetical protein